MVSKVWVLKNQGTVKREICIARKFVTFGAFEMKFSLLIFLLYTLCMSNSLRSKIRLSEYGMFNRGNSHSAV